MFNAHSRELSVKRMSVRELYAMRERDASRVNHCWIIFDPR